MAQQAQEDRLEFAKTNPQVHKKKVKEDHVHYRKTQEYMNSPRHQKTLSQEEPEPPKEVVVKRINVPRHKMHLLRRDELAKMKEVPQPRNRQQLTTERIAANVQKYNALTEPRGVDLYVESA